MNIMTKVKESLSEDESGEMGIGMMIIFIAMVLVAAVAAAVIINTANSVREQAQSTGDEAISDVSTGFEVMQSLGDRNNYAGTTQATIQYLEIKVELHSGSPDVAMGDVIIEITDGDNQATLSFNSDVADATSNANAKHLYTNATDFSAIALIDDDSTFVDGTTDTSFVVNEGDVIKIFVNVTSLSLSENVDVDLRIIPRYGSPTLELFTTPDTYTDRYVELDG
jgi:flagellin FlaB